MKKIRIFLVTLILSLSFASVNIFADSLDLGVDVSADGDSIVVEISADKNSLESLDASYTVYGFDGISYIKLTTPSEDNANNNKVIKVENGTVTFPVNEGGTYHLTPTTYVEPTAPATSITSTTSTTTVESKKTSTTAKTITLDNGDKKQIISNTESVITKTNGTILREITVKGDSDIKISADTKLIPSGTVLQQTELSKDSDDYKVVEEAINNNSALKLDEAEEIFAYNFDLTQSNGTEIHELDGYVEVSLPVPSNITVGTNQHITAYRVNDDGSLTKCETEVVDGVITFKTDHFSTYIFALEEDEPVVTTTTAEEKTTEVVEDTTVTTTNSFKLPIIILCVVALVGIVVAIIKVKNSK